MNRQKLVPLKVDWSISRTSGCNLKMNDAPKSSLEFLIYYKREFLMFEKNQSVNNEVDLESKNFEKKMTLEFQTGWGRMSPQYSPQSEINYNDYDCSDLFSWCSEFIKGNEVFDIDGYQKEFDRLWLETKICPDPSIYEIVISNWIEEVDRYKNDALKHYLILGYDFNAEIITKDLEFIENDIVWKDGKK